MQTQLVTRWLDLRRVSGDKTAKASALYLCRALDAKYSASRLWEWEHGKRPVPENVASFMRSEILPSLFTEESLDDRETQEKIMRILKVLIN